MTDRETEIETETVTETETDRRTQRVTEFGSCHRCVEKGDKCSDD